MRTSQSLEGPYADAREFVDLWVSEALEGHGESHLFQLIRDMTANHGGRGQGKGQT